LNVTFTYKYTRETSLVPLILNESRPFDISSSFSHRDRSTGLQACAVGWRPHALIRFPRSAPLHMGLWWWLNGHAHWRIKIVRLRWA
jgi:hypothetical protein